jgi:hypothetical protein
LRRELGEASLGEIPASGEHRDTIADGGDGVHVMLDQKDREALVDQPAKMPGDLARERRIDAGHRFVEEQQLRLRHQDAAELEQLLLSTGERRRRLVQYADQIEPLGDLVSGLHQLGLAPSRRREAKEGPPDPFAWLPVAVEQQVLVYAQARKTARDLEGAHQADAGDAIGSPAGDVVPREDDPTRMRRHDPGNAIEERRLARPVGPDQPRDPVRVDAQVHPFEGVHAAKAARQLVDFEERWHCR